MSKRLKILEASLIKKQSAFDSSLQAHFDDVKSANGQPLNDKGKRGQATLRRWERQNDALRAKAEGIEKTKAAIEREQSAISRVERAEFPEFIREMIEAGTLTIWRKHPQYLFVAGVGKARIKYEDGKLYACHFRGLDQAQYTIFRDTFNGMNKRLRGEQ